MEQLCEEFNQRLIGGALDWRCRQPDKQTAVAFAGEGRLAGARDDADIDLDARCGGVNQTALASASGTRGR